MKWIEQHVTMGSIDVNIMTKVDKTNYADEALPAEFNDAHAALRGFANSKLSSSVVLSPSSSSSSSDSSSESASRMIPHCVSMRVCNMLRKSD